MNLNRYNNLIEATSDLKSKGYKNTFQLEDGTLRCHATQKIYQPGDMHIIEYHRFEEDGKDAEQSILCVIECHDGVKGTIVSSYGTYYDLPLMQFIDKVRIKSSNDFSASA